MTGAVDSSGSRRAESVLDLIGGTPLVRLSRFSRNVKAGIWGKVEYLNPGGSVKDRIALRMIQAAERAGELKPGGTIIEATAGNTGVGLAMVAAVKRYRCIFVLPDKMSRDKIDLLRAYGAEVVITPTSVAPDSSLSYNGVADRLAREIPGAFRPNQFFNEANPEAHYLTTGPEIVSALDGKVDAFVAGAGTGGTISGVGRYLKEHCPGVKVVLADPEGSVLSGDSPKSYLVEGIGEDFIPRTFDRQVIDDFVRVSDGEAFRAARRLAREEGLLVGGSAGTALAAALRYAVRLPEGSNVVAFLPDTGRNYLSRVFNDDWMREKGFLEERPTDAMTVRDVLAVKTTMPLVLSVRPDQPLPEVVELMRQWQVSQVPVIGSDGVLGQVDEVSLLKILLDAGPAPGRLVKDAMGLPPPVVEETTPLTEAYRILLSGHQGILVARRSLPFAYLTRTDLVEFLSRGQSHAD